MLVLTYQCITYHVGECGLVGKNVREMASVLPFGQLKEQYERCSATLVILGEQ